MTPHAATKHPPALLGEKRPCWIPLEGAGIGFVRAEARSLFTAAGLRTLEDFLAATGEALSKPGLKNRYRARLILGTQTAPVVVYLKRFGRESWATVLRRCYEDRLHEDPGSREARVANELLQLRIPVPQPMAWGQCTSGPARNPQSFVVLAAVAGVAAHRWLAESLTHPDSWALRRRFSQNLVALARRFHHAGWRHRDFYLCHIFVHENDGTLELSLIDLQRAFQPRLRPGRWLVKDLAQLNYSASQFCSRGRKLRFILDYLGVATAGVGEKKLIRQIAAKTAAIAARDERKNTLEPEANQGQPTNDQRKI